MYAYAPPSVGRAFRKVRLYQQVGITRGVGALFNSENAFKELSCAGAEHRVTLRAESTPVFPQRCRSAAFHIQERSEPIPRKQTKGGIRVPSVKKDFQKYICPEKAGIEMSELVVFFGDTPDKDSIRYSAPDGVCVRALYAPRIRAGRQVG